MGSREPGTQVAGPRLFLAAYHEGTKNPRRSRSMILYKSFVFFVELRAFVMSWLHLKLTHPGSTHFVLVSSAPSPPGADPPRNSFAPLGSVMFLPTALFDRSLA